MLLILFNVGSIADVRGEGGGGGGAEAGPPGREGGVQDADRSAHTFHHHC